MDILAQVAFRDCLARGLAGEMVGFLGVVLSDFEGRSSATGRKTVGEAEGYRASLRRKDPQRSPQSTYQTVSQPFTWSMLYVGRKTTQRLDLHVCW